MARRRRSRRSSTGHRRRARSTNGVGFVLVVLAVLVAVLVLAAQDDEPGSSGGENHRDRREAAQAAEDAQERSDPADGHDDEIGNADRSAGELLDTLVVRAEGSDSGYRRDEFGDGWRVDENGCDTRELVLAEESKAPITRRADCSVVEGRWLSLYDGDTTRDPDDLQIDHMVPLAEAWESGASAWPADRREDYANDMRRHGALIAVSSGMNESKSDRDPAEWMPPDQGSWCRYANAWIVEKHDWHLTVDRAEQRKLRDVLATCG